MSLHTLLAELSEKDVRVSVENDRLKIRAPKGILTPELQETLSRYKFELLGLLQQKKAEQEAFAIPLVRQPRDRVSPLSSSQKRCWFSHQLAEGNAAYNMPFALRLSGPFDPETLERSLGEIIRRHEIFRTTFPQQEGVPVQMIAPPAPFSLPIRDASTSSGTLQDDEVQKLLEDEARKGFELGKEPSFRAILLRIGPEDSVLFLNIHHIVFDMWSMQVLLAEMIQLYQAFSKGESSPLAELPLQYVDYGIWEEQWLRSASVQTHLTYWKAHLADVPRILEFPTDYPRPGVLSYKGNVLRLQLSQRLTDQLDAFSRQQEVTLFTTLCAIFQLLVYRYSGQARFLLSTVDANRPRQELEKLIGFFVNQLLIRADLSNEWTFLELLQQVHQEVLEMHRHNKNIPFSLLLQEMQPERDPSRNPLFQMSFIFENTPPPPLKFSESLSARLIDIPTHIARMDSTVAIFPNEEGLLLYWEYSTDLFREETISLLLQAFQKLSEDILQSPERPLSIFELPNSLQERVQEMQTFQARNQDQSVAVEMSDRKMVIAASFTVEPIREVLDFWFRERHLAFQTEFAPYHQIFQQLLDPESLLAKNTQGINCVLFRFEDWLNIQQNDPVVESSTTEAVQTLEGTIHDFIQAIRENASHSDVPWLIGLCPASPKALHHAELKECFSRLEQSLETSFSQLSNVFLVSSEEFLFEYPVERYYDPHSDQLGHVPFPPAFFAALGTTLMRRIAAMQRRPYKVVVLDCDNTLWNGVCGEDGVSGVQFDAPYIALQRFMLKQYDAGMLLCLCSKNNEEDVFAVFDIRPEMVLKREHLVSARMNWKPKSENLASLAQELNLGLDSFIFIDDNPLECAEVEANCPEVLTLPLPSEPERIPQFLAHVWAFDHLRITKEDKQRTVLYQQNVQRERVRRDALTFQSFLEQLELKIAIHEPSSSQFSRAAQLTQRTNQFNMTTIRRSEGELQTLCRKEGELECLVTEVSDRFGDYGLVGVMLFAADSEAICVESFLLSCRALGRGVEHRMLAELGALARSRNLKRVDVCYRRSPKNQPALDFLESQGLEFKEELKEEWIFRFPSEFAAAVKFQPKEAAASVEQKRTSSRRQVFEESQELLRRIATELYDANQILTAISAQKHRERPELEIEFVAPRTPVEEELANIWGDLLELDRVGVHDDFFKLGGHSLLATQILSRVIERFQINLPLQSLLEDPTIAGIAEQIETLTWATSGRDEQEYANDDEREGGEL